MNNYRFRQKPTLQTYGTKTQQRLLLVLLIALLAAVIMLGALYAGDANYKTNAMAQFQRRIKSNLVDAIGQVGRMSGSVQSNSFIKIGLIRQHVYTMDQINAVSIAISGELGRIIPQEAVAALFSDLDRYETTIQTATGSTLEVRTQLLTHLMALQETLGN
jgi:hypothetical protein